MNGYAGAFFSPAPSYPIVDRLTDGPAVVDLRQMAPLRLFAAQTHQQAPRCPRSVNGVRPFALPLASAPCSLISRPPAASSSSSVPHGYRLNFAVPVLASDHAIPLSLPPDHGRRSLPSPCFSQGAHRPLRPPFTASTGQLSCRLLRSPPSILLPAQSRCTRRPAKRACSPSSPFACSTLPCSTPSDCRLRPAPPLQFPAAVSRSSLYSLPLACASHAHHQTRGHVSFPQRSSATRDLSSALLTFPSPTPSPPSFAPRVHGSTLHLPLDLLPSTPPLASDPSQPPKSVTALAHRTHPSHSCRRSVLSLFPTPSASSPM